MDKMHKLRDIPDGDREKIQEVLSQCSKAEEGIIFAYLHGSFAEGKAFRDIDVGVYVEEFRVPRKQALDFEISVSTKLQETIRIPVDLRVINYAPLSFQYYSTTGILLMCKEDEVHVDFLTKTRSLYFDFKPASERFLKEMLHAE